MEMIERVADAIRDALPVNVEFTDEYMRKEVLRAARAAIEAMREPTEEMLDAPSRDKIMTELFNENGSVIADEGLAYGWSAMIDAALK